MIKLIGCAMIISSFTTLGILAKRQLYVRVKLLSDMINTIELMQRELKFNQLKTHELILKVQENSRTSLKEIFSKIAQIDEFSITHSWAKQFYEQGEKIGFANADIAIIRDISKILGKFDTYEQINALENIKAQLERNLNDAKNKFINDGNIVRTTVFMVGLTIVIILF